MAKFKITNTANRFALGIGSGVDGVTSMDLDGTIENGGNVTLPSDMSEASSLTAIEGGNIKNTGTVTFPYSITTFSPRSYANQVELNFSGASGLDIDSLTSTKGQNVNIELPSDFYSNPSISTVSGNVSSKGYSINGLPFVWKNDNTGEIVEKPEGVEDYLGNTGYVEVKTYGEWTCTTDSSKNVNDATDFVISDDEAVAYGKEEFTGETNFTGYIDTYYEIDGNSDWSANSITCTSVYHNGSEIACDIDVDVQKEQWTYKWERDGYSGDDGGDKPSYEPSYDGEQASTDFDITINVTWSANTISEAEYEWEFSSAEGPQNSSEYHSTPSEEVTGTGESTTTEYSYDFTAYWESYETIPEVHCWTKTGSVPSEAEQWEYDEPSDDADSFEVGYTQDVPASAIGMIDVPVDQYSVDEYTDEDGHVYSNYEVGEFGIIGITNNYGSLNIEVSGKVTNPDSFQEVFVSGYTDHLSVSFPDYVEQNDTSVLSFTNTSVTMSYTGYCDITYEVELVSPAEYEWRLTSDEGESYSTEGYGQTADEVMPTDEITSSEETTSTTYTRYFNVEWTSYESSPAEYEWAVEINDYDYTTDDYGASQPDWTPTSADDTSTTEGHKTGTAYWVAIADSSYTVYSSVTTSCTLDLSSVEPIDFTDSDTEISIAGPLSFEPSNGQISGNISYRAIVECEFKRSVDYESVNLSCHRNDED